mmetsp:Transcript_21506/g.34698  ORF Transcript_21506/g.34698 Transcript_21506/m.34698 type:complete len:214 (+) Transcript_21506:143-784(+)
MNSYFTAFQKDDMVLNLVHNAGVIEPITPLMKLDLEAFRSIMRINVEGPLFLTQQLLSPPSPHLNHESRVLFVGSGAAHKPYHSWGGYCMSKAALHMMYQVFKEEKTTVTSESGQDNMSTDSKDSPISSSRLVLPPRFGSIRPGVVDTPMQQTLRTAQDFENVQFFKNLKEEGKLVSSEKVAKFIDFLLHDTEPDEFERDEWDIRDAAHQSRW